MIKKNIKNLRFQAVYLLRHYLYSDYPLDEKIIEISKLCQFEEKDQRLFHEIALGVTRNLSLLEYIIKNYLNNKKIKKTVLTILDVAFYQALFLDRIPYYAVISEAMKTADFLKINLYQKKFLRAVLANFSKDVSGYREDLKWKESLPYSIKFSQPEWLIEYWKNELTDEELVNCLKAGISKPIFCLFPNEAKITLEALVDKIENLKIKFEITPNQKGILIYKWQPWLDKLLMSGDIFIQSPHQYDAIEICPALEGETVLEICAAPGGKSIHLNKLVGGRGKVYAIDKNPARLKKLEERIKVCNLSNVVAKVQDILEDFSKDLPLKYDHVVLDAPCSNLGELLRRPEVRFWIKLEDIEKLHALQLKMVLKGWEKLKVKGTFLYMTCTLTKKENQVIRDYILEHLKGLFLKEILCIPSPENPFGGYACLLKKI